MLGEILVQETGSMTGIRVLPPENGETMVEVSLATQGTIRDIGQNCIWTYWSKTRADGTVYGEGHGVMTTADGDVIHLRGAGASKAPGPDGVVHYRGAVYLTTAAGKLSDLNGAVGVHEYDVDAEGSTKATWWEWS